MKAGRLALAQGRRSLLGWGAAYPGPAVSTHELCERVEHGFGVPTQRWARWLSAKIGVQTRHLCRDFAQAQEAPRAGDRNPELAAAALHRALTKADLPPDSLAYLMSHTTTPAQCLPAGSAEIARLIGHTGAHLELRQACTGFANALQMAFALTASPDAPPVAIVGVETGSVFFDPHSLQERSAQWVNFLQMGDGAAAVIIGPDQGRDDCPTISAAFFGQAQQAPEPGLRLRVGGSDHAWANAGTLAFEHDYDSVLQEGLALLEHGRAALAGQGHEIEQAAWVVPHQASGAVAPWLAKRWGLPLARVCAHGARVGNMGSASIWAALDDVLLSAPSWPTDRALFLGAEATQYSCGGFVLERPQRGL